MGVQEVLAAGVYTMSSGRIIAGAAAVAGLAGVIAGARALARPARGPALFSLAAALVALVGGGFVAATSDSGIGTGNGRGGAYVAMVLGVISLVVGGLVLARSRRVSAP
ncbi:hypothetical protein GCM10010112_15780 [Actinoplanes lobatus]|uniref:Uncharacterized protein n=1 Tax=Actinoplanes lobatus TaxID=113568 RepID=A0A7W7MKI3_9ACTN|nr:DUF6223 family protein [Actinoplanes lobatus]MBB4753406.1 hypothetical protein [Actinoplanes lobatus]GGN60025.1 hypothetical protein GCM10010112_15780 [Actinoplanes lobatus]GIE37940.1 hypothetical protein Alo02nite_08380 [Actinoplanes lobatus]